MKTRVAFFFTTLEKGGAEHQALLLLNGIDRTQFDVRVLSVLGGPLQAELTKEGFPVIVLNAETPRVLPTIKKVRQYLLAQQIHVLHCLLWHTNIIGRFACIGTKTKCINSVRWAERHPRDIIDYSTRFLVDKWIANSKHGAALAHLPKQKTTVIYNGLAADLLRTPLSAWQPKPKTAIMVGKFRREKQFDVLIEAARLLPDWQFTLVGDGPLLEQAKQHVKRIHVKNVTFTGHRADVSQLLLTHSVSLLLSKSEGSPNVTIESLALGVPFIGSNIPAHQELLAEGRGTLVQANPKVIANLLQKSEQVDAKKLQAQRIAAQTFIRTLFSTETMVTETQRVWRATAQTI
jgi:glycosyltransferase involved in cell wall biosynthesis